MFENIALPKKIWEPQIILGKNQCTKNLNINKKIFAKLKKKKPIILGMTKALLLSIKLTEFDSASLVLM